MRHAISFADKNAISIFQTPNMGTGGPFTLLAKTFSLEPLNQLIRAQIHETRLISLDDLVKNFSFMRPGEER